MGAPGGGRGRFLPRGGQPHKGSGRDRAIRDRAGPELHWSACERFGGNRPTGKTEGLSMGDARYVFHKYVRHALNNVNSKPSIPFKSNRAWVMKLSSLYIIGNTKNANECFIDAHGGNYSAYYVIDNQNSGCGRGCMSASSSPRATPSSASSRTCGTARRGGTADQDHDAGDECPNDMLTKFQGRHSGGRRADGGGPGDRLPGLPGHRPGRRHHAQDRDPRHPQGPAEITTFNCMFCRVDDTTASLARVTWNASPGTGGNWY